MSTPAGVFHQFAIFPCIKCVDDKVILDPPKEASQVIRHEEAVVFVRLLSLRNKEETISGRKMTSRSDHQLVVYRAGHSCFLALSVRTTIFIHFFQL